MATHGRRDGHAWPARWPLMARSMAALDPLDHRGSQRSCPCLARAMAAHRADQVQSSRQPSAAIAGTKCAHRARDARLSALSNVDGTDGKLCPAMDDPDATPSPLVVAELNNPEVMRALRDAAMWRAKVECDAKDLLGKTLLQVIDPRGVPWDPSERAFVTHVKFVMKKVWYRDRRERRHEAEVFDGGDAQESTGDDRPRADDEVDRERTLAVQRMLGERMAARLAYAMAPLRASSCSACSAARTVLCVIFSRSLYS